MKCKSCSLKGIYQLTIPIPETLKDVVILVGSDYYRNCEKEIGLGGYFATITRQCTCLVQTLLNRYIPFANVSIDI